MAMLAEIRCPLVLAMPNQNHRRTDSHNDAQIISCSLVGSHKFKPNSQYNVYSGVIENKLLKYVTRVIVTSTNTDKLCN